MKAAEATKKAQQGKQKIFRNIIRQLENRVDEAAEDGKPSLNVELGDGSKKFAYLDQIIKHFEKDDYDVSVDGSYLTIYWGLEDSEIEEQ